MLRMRAEEYAELVRILLYRVGAIPTADILLPGIRMWHKYKNDPELVKAYEGMQEVFHEIFPGLLDEAQRTGNGIDPGPFIKQTEKRIGRAGARMAIEFIEEFAIYQEQNPWSRIRRVEWSDTQELADLFKSEELTTSYGHFFDQRFIDYLHRNFDSIAKINWRKFEGLVAEFFARAGLHPELGAGRNDDGVDVRVWPGKRGRHLPPALLIQCKRQKAKVEKVVVKALWADVEHEQARSGLIVTTTTLSPGAKKTCTARAYKIAVADRPTLRTWVDAMRTPNAGVFLGG